MKSKSLLLFFLILGVVVCVSGCVETGQNQSTNTSQKPVYVLHTVVCPNPECVLHDPDRHVGSAYEHNQRPIDMEYDAMGNPHYLCQVCGEQF